MAEMSLEEALPLASIWPRSSIAYVMPPMTMWLGNSLKRDVSLANDSRIREEKRTKCVWTVKSLRSWDIMPFVIALKRIGNVMSASREKMITEHAWKKNKNPCRFLKVVITPIRCPLVTKKSLEISATMVSIMKISWFPVPIIANTERFYYFWASLW